MLETDYSEIEIDDNLRIKVERNIKPNWSYYSSHLKNILRQLNKMSVDVVFAFSRKQYIVDVVTPNVLRIVNKSGYQMRVALLL